MRILILLALYVGSVFGQPVPSDAQYVGNGNMLVNPSFEQGRTGWTISSGVVTLDRVNYFHLRQALRVCLTDETLGVSQNIVQPPGVAGKKLVVGVNVRPEVAGIEVCNVENSIETSCISASELNAWNVLIGEIGTAPASGNGIIIKSTGNVTGCVNIDNAIVRVDDGLGGGGGGSLPPGGNAGAALTKTTSDPGDADWDNFVIEGFSQRFNAAWSSAGLRDTIDKIINITYLAPQVSLSGSSNTLREKGDSVASITLSANVTKRSDDIARILFRQGVTTIEDYNPPANTGSGVTTAGYSTPFSDNITFTVEVTDNGDTGGPTTVSSNTTYSFVYPYYYGAGAPSLTPAQVAALTKNIINSTATLNRSFTAVDGNVYYFAYPASYGSLTSILDENGFEVIGAWTQRTENITGLDSTPVSYFIYESNNPVVAGTTNFTFIR